MLVVGALFRVVDVAAAIAAEPVWEAARHRRVILRAGMLGLFQRVAAASGIVGAGKAHTGILRAAEQRRFAQPRMPNHGDIPRVHLRAKRQHIQRAAGSVCPENELAGVGVCLLYTSPSPRD